MEKALDAGGEERAAMLLTLKGRVRAMTFDAEGCRAVQELLVGTESREVAPLVAELHGFAREALQSPYANYVLQKIIEVLPVAHSAFIVDELRGSAADMACHRYGCRIFCRLLEHASAHDGPAALIDEALGRTGYLCRHAFGHYVVQSVLEHGLAEQRQKIAETLCDDLLVYIKNRNACYVVEEALSLCSVADKQAIMDGITSLGPEQLASLAKDSSGSIVLRAALRCHGVETAATQLAQQLAAASVAPLAEANKYGRRVLDDLKASSKCDP